MTIGTDESTITVRDETGRLDIELTLDDLARTTPQHVINHLIAEGKLVNIGGDAAQAPYNLAFNGVTLPIDESLAKHQVRDGDTLMLVRGNKKGC